MADLEDIPQGRHQDSRMEVEPVGHIGAVRGAPWTPPAETRNPSAP